jgi:cytochrome c oxidase cbb3-type subunit 3
MSHSTKDEKTVKLLDHNYDGIQELDNPLPGWWLQTFYWAIVFAVFYFTYYELGGGPDQWTELKHDMAPIEAAQAKAKGQGYVDEDVSALLTQGDRISAGKKTFAEKCSSCHGNEAQGQIGPNLTDAFWIHGDGKPGAIAKVISEGVPDKGMPSWGPLLPRAELLSVAAFIVTLKGSHPAQPKAPQGQEYP